MKIHVYKNPDEVNIALADFFVEKCNEAIAVKGYANVVLSGGNSPKKLHELLAAEYATKTSWTKINFFFGDERYVPFESPDNNGAMAKRTLFDPLNIDESKIFYIDTSLEPEDAAEAYAMIFPSAVDFIFLGLGDNVHTASLFPYTDILDEKSPTVKNIYVEEVKAMRISLTAPLINQAKTIAFLVYGAGKAEAVHDAIEGEENYKKFPAQLIKPSNGEVHWFLDQASAKPLTSQK